MQQPARGRDLRIPLSRSLSLRAPQATLVGCEGYGHWQRGSAPQHYPLTGKSFRRKEQDINGNALYIQASSLYALGCAAFEEYMCRAQAFFPAFAPTCPRVAGCATGGPHEEGFDRVLFHFRRKARNVVYARTALPRFAYTPFIQSFGRQPHAPHLAARPNNRTFFAHSAAVHYAPAALRRAMAALEAARAQHATSEIRPRPYYSLDARRHTGWGHAAADRAKELFLGRRPPQLAPRRPFPAEDPIGLSCVSAGDGTVVPRAPRALPARERVGLRVAVAVPFVARQLVRLERTMERWATFAPCVLQAAAARGADGGDGGARRGGPAGSVTVVFVFDGDLESEATRVKWLLEGLWERLVRRTGLERCFGGGGALAPAPFELISMRLDHSWGHLEGAAAMFYGLFPILEQRYHAFLLAESDCLPVRSGWVDGLLAEASLLGCDGYGHWQRGSAPQHHPFFGRLNRRHDAHINGNGLYLLGCAAFEEYMCRAQSHFPAFEPDCPRMAGCATGRQYEDGCGTHTHTHTHTHTAL